MIRVGSMVKFVSQSAADRWGRFKLGKAYEVISEGDTSCQVRDESKLGWWIRYDSLVLAEEDKQVTLDGWGL